MASARLALSIGSPGFSSRPYPACKVGAPQKCVTRVQSILGRGQFQEEQELLAPPPPTSQSIFEMLPKLQTCLQTTQLSLGQSRWKRQAQRCNQ